MTNQKSHNSCKLQLRSLWLVPKGFELAVSTCKTTAGSQGCCQREGRCDVRTKALEGDWEWSPLSSWSNINQALGLISVPHKNQS